MRNKFKILTTFWFLAGLALLLLNDFVLKELYGNWLTGKLSDFTGLFIFPLFWSALFPKHKMKIFWVTGLFFVFWKSEFSQYLIDIWNINGLLTISRVIDYTDLMALLVLPLAFYADNIKWKLKRVKLHPIIPILLASFSFMATSYQTRLDINKTYAFDFPKDTLENRFNQIDKLDYTYNDKLINSQPDMLEILIPYDLCPDGITVKFTIEEVSNGKTKLTLIDAFHTCPAGDDEEERITKIFELKIIDHLNKTGS